MLSEVCRCPKSNLFCPFAQGHELLRTEKNFVVNGYALHEKHNDKKTTDTPRHFAFYITSQTFW